MAETHAESAEPIHFGGATLARHRHVCAFFHTCDEEYRVLLPFIERGSIAPTGLFTSWTRNSEKTIWSDFAPLTST